MDEIRVVYKNEDGVAIIIPSRGENIDEVIAKGGPDGAEYKIIEASEIPSDREFREAWEYSSGVDVSFEKAKEVQRNRWREVRRGLFNVLDIEFLRASEIGDAEKIDIIKQKKQILRDVTLTDLSSVTSLEELKEIWPECLLSD